MKFLGDQSTVFNKLLPISPLVIDFSPRMFSPEFEDRVEWPTDSVSETNS